MTKTDESTLQIHKHANDYRDLCNFAGESVIYTTGALLWIS